MMEEYAIQYMDRLELLGKALDGESAGIPHSHISAPPHRQYCNSKRVFCFSDGGQAVFIGSLFFHHLSLSTARDGTQASGGSGGATMAKPPGESSTKDGGGGGGGDDAGTGMHLCVNIRPLFLELELPLW